MVKSLKWFLGLDYLYDCALLIRWSEIYEGTEVLSPIDRETWNVIGKDARIGPSSRVLELASGKGVFAMHLARNFGCNVEGIDVNPEFVEYSSARATGLGLASKARFARSDVNDLRVQHDAYDLGVCLGALHIFRESGWRVLMQSVRSGGCFAISDMFCKKVSAPKEIMDVFFEEGGQPFTREDARQWYTSKGAEILREEECSRKAWLEYYDSTRKNILQLAERYRSDRGKMLEIEDALREDALVRELGEEYLGYVTFIMRKPSS